jgi:chromosomal replication initiator protein
LVRVNAYAALHDSPINLSLVTRALQDIIKAPAARPVTVEVIQEEVAKYFGIKTSEMKSKRRTRNITFPRQIAMYLSRELTDNSLSQIGAAFGGRDHTTVIHAYEKIDSEMKLDPMLKNTIEEVIERIHRS